MVNLLEAARAYESNLTILQSAKQLSNAALEIGLLIQQDLLLFCRLFEKAVYILTLLLPAGSFHNPVK